MAHTGERAHAPPHARRTAPGRAEFLGMRLGSRPTDAAVQSYSPLDADPEATVEQRCCDGCGRVPLIGERVALYGDSTLRCELCAALLAERPVSESIVRYQPDGPRSRVRVIRQLPR